MEELWTAGPMADLSVSYKVCGHGCPVSAAVGCPRVLVSVVAVQGEELSVTVGAPCLQVPGEEGGG